MSDPFALLGLPRRPWLDEAAVRVTFQQRSRQAHPDAPGGDAATFAELNAAHAALKDPAARLKLLVGGEALPAAPPDQDFGFRLAGALRHSGQVAGKRAATENPISRALLAGEVAAIGATLEKLSEELELKEAAALERLRVADARWPQVDGLAELAAEFVFLARWRTQLREARLTLKIA